MHSLVLSVVSKGCIPSLSSGHRDFLLSDLGERKRVPTAEILELQCLMSTNLDLMLLIENLQFKITNPV